MLYSTALFTVSYGSPCLKRDVVKFCMTLRRWDTLHSTFCSGVKFPFWSISHACLILVAILELHQSQWPLISTQWLLHGKLKL